MALYTAQIEKLYVTFFNRPADFSGLAYWEGQMVNTNGNSAVIANAFAASAEYKALYAGKSTAATIETIYQNLFGRAAEPDAIQYWGVRLDNGTFNIGTIANSIAVGAQNLDATTIANKVTAATAFTATLDTNAEILGYETTTNGQAVKDWLKAVTSDAATLTAATTALPALVTSVVTNSNANPGTTFTLTAGVDAVIGGSGNDTVNGVVDATAAAAGYTNLTSISGIDSVVGGAGNDTLNITTLGGVVADALNGASVSAVETINLRATTGANASLAATNVAGVTAINSNLSTGTLTLTAVANTTSVGIIGNGTIVTGDLTATYAATATSPVLNLSGGTNGGNVSVTAAGATSFTVNSTGAANTIGTLAAPGAATSTMTVNAATNLTTGAITTAVKQITVTGAATSVTLGAQTAANLTTIDASGMTVGGVTDTLLATITSFKGGAGTDTVTTIAAGTQLGATAVIDAGAGAADKLVLANVGSIITAAEGAKYVNFEVLNVGAAVQQDVSLVAGITSEILSVSGAGLKNLTAAQAAAVTVQATNAGASIALQNATGTADALTVALTNATAATAATVINLTTATIDGFETLNVSANSGITTAMTAAVAAATTTYDLIGFTSAADLKTINVSGAYDVGINLANAVKVTSLDLSQNTGGGTVVTLAANTGALVVTGSNAADFVTLATAAGTGTQTINAGLGNDTISGTQAQIAVATINGGGGVDTIAFTGGGSQTILDNTFTNATAIEKLTSDAVTGLNWVVGGYANAIATANGGVLDVTAAKLVDTAGVVVDASGLSTGNSLKLSLTETAATAGAGITITQSAGADNITVAMTATSIGALVISGGTAALASTSAKTVDLSSVAAATSVTVTTGAGNDVIKTAAVNGTYTGGLGSDTFTAGAGVDTFVLGTNGSVIGTSLDKITSFSAADKMTFAATLAVTADATAAAAGSNVSQNAAGLLTFATADNTLALKIAAIQADVQLDAAGSIALFTDGANQYVYFAGAAIGNADDQLIELTGITTLTTVVGGAGTITFA